MGIVYTGVFSGVSVTAAQDLFELLAPAARSVILHSVAISQSSNTDSEQLRLTIRRVTGAPTSGSGGSTVTPASAVPGLTFDGTLEANNTTRISGGTQATLWDEGQNVLNGWQYLPVPEDRLEAEGGSRLVIGLEAAPADALTMSGVIVFEVIGGV